VIAEGHVTSLPFLACTYDFLGVLEFKVFWQQGFDEITSHMWKFE